MKSLIVVAGYGIKNHNKRVEVELLNKLQPIRNEYDILYISHTHANELIQDLIDYSIYDSKNSLIYDFNYKPKFWWGNEDFYIETTEKYRFCTHNSIFRMMSMASNFSKFMKYKKLHYIEYDIDLQDINVIKEVDNHLNNSDTVVFIKEENNWLFGCYFAFKPDSYNFLDDFDEKKFLSYLSLTDNNFTERVLKSLLISDKKYKKLVYENHFNNVGQKIKSLVKEDRLSWTIPVYNEINGKMEFFINVDQKVNNNIKIITNDDYCITFNITKEDFNKWMTKSILSVEKVKKIECYINGKLDYILDFNKININEFIKRNKIVYKK
jgi:hypothetical protein